MEMEQGVQKQGAAELTWKVTFDGGFWSSKGHGGKERPLEGVFTWAGRQWLVPAVYVCGRGLVLDVCMRVETQAVREFAEKWDLTPETEDKRTFTPAEKRQLERENPLTFDYFNRLYVNGRLHLPEHSYGVCYNPVFPVKQDIPAALVEHYGLDPDCAWVIRRCSFPWQTVRKPQIKTLSLEMEQRPVEMEADTFQVKAPGEKITLTRPATGETYVLTVKEYEAQEMKLDPHQGLLEYPSHLWAMTYTVRPEAENLRLTDCAPSDEIRPSSNAGIGIIGGADGPTAIFVGQKKSKRLHGVCSSVHFQPVESVTWQASFLETEYEKGNFLLLD